MSRIVRIMLITALLLGTLFLHYFTSLHKQHYHILYQTLAFLPIVLASFWFGLRGALLTALTLTSAYIPFIIAHWQGFSASDFDRLMDLFIYNVVGLTVGGLRDREKAEQRRLQESEKLAALGKALSGAAHDMKTPLIAIGGFTNLVLKKLHQTDPFDPEGLSQVLRIADEKLSIVINETRRLENMVRDMLDFSRPLRLARSKTDLSIILEETFSLLKGRAHQHRVTLVKQYPEEFPQVSLDIMRIKQVLINLIMNAIQASPQGGEVKVCVYFEGTDLVIDVVDCGCGIPLQERVKIFSPFYTTRQEGTGLGLPIVRKIVEAHGGEVHILDNLGKGLTFRIKIPPE